MNGAGEVGARPPGEPTTRRRPKERVGIGFLGCGTVGLQAINALLASKDRLRARAGIPMDVVRIAVRTLVPERGLDLPPETWTTNPKEVVDDPEVDVVVEVMGGVEPARALVLDALGAGKHVVTANKELLAVSGRDLTDAARATGVALLFEASVAAGIPIIRPLKESLAGDRVRRVIGIVNGTSNYILTRMSERGETFADALAQARRLGYTEVDPSSDTEGLDAASKVAILASVAFNARVVGSDVHTEGITRVGRRDIEAAHDLGYEIKLIGIAEDRDKEVSVGVHPAMLPTTHPLAAVRDVYNAIFLECEGAGQLMFFGHGAGGVTTASAVVGDLVEIARNIATGSQSVGCTCYQERATIRSPDDSVVRYYVVLSVMDRPGVLSEVAGVFAAHEISIASVRQEGFGDEAVLVLITHAASEGAHRATFTDLDGLDVVKRLESRIRVHGTDEG
ncbi:homoserine dehydrogenase [soil metagenome]